jgi:serine/threonine-protein kinase
VVTSVLFAITTERQSEVIAFEAATAEEVSAFLVQLFEFTDPVDGFGDTVAARTILDRGAERISETLEDRPEIRARMMYTLGQVYDNLGLYNDAERLHQEALDIRRQLHPGANEDVAESLEALAAANLSNRGYIRAGQLYTMALEQRALLGSDSLQIAADLRALGNAIRSHDPDSSVALMRTVYTIRSEQLGEDALLTIYAKHDVAYALRGQGKLDSAEALYREILPTLRLRSDSAGHILAPTLNNLAFIVGQRGEDEEAIRLYEESLETGRRWGITINQAQGHANLGMALERTGQDRRAKEQFRTSLDILDKQFPDGHWRVGAANVGLASHYVRLGDTLASIEPFRAALESYIHTLGPNHTWTKGTTGLLGYALAVVGQFDEAEALLLEALEFTKQSDGASFREEALRRVVKLYTDWGRVQDAARYEAMLRAEGFEAGR